VRRFTIDNVELSAQLKSTIELLDKTQQQRDQANQQLITLREKIPTVTPLQTTSLDSQIKNQIEENQQLTARLSSSQQRQPESAAFSLFFGIAFSSDGTQGQAMTEVKKAQQLPPVPIVLFQRQKFLRSVALFPTRELATAALPSFRSKVRADSYIVDLRTWCPAGLNATITASDPPQTIDCRF
jgi:hypothetical protein